MATTAPMTLQKNCDCRLILSRSHVWDPVGNRLLNNADGSLTTGTFDAANQVVTMHESDGVYSYSFDPAGNQEKILHPTGTRTTYGWNYENMNSLIVLPTNARVTMAYCAINRRVDKSE